VANVGKTPTRLGGTGGIGVVRMGAPAGAARLRDTLRLENPAMHAPLYPEVPPSARRFGMTA
jgi:hypothetical protein